MLQRDPPRADARQWVRVECGTDVLRTRRAVGSCDPMHHDSMASGPDNTSTPAGLARRIAGLATVWLAVAALGGCANQAVTRSGYLAAYDRLQPESADSKNLVERPSAGALSGFDTVFVDPVEVRLSTTEDDAAMQEVAALATVALREEIGLQWSLADSPADARTLRVRAALTAVKTANPALNVVLFIILPVPLDNGGLSAEAEFLGGDPQEHVGAIVWAGQGLWNPTGYFSAYGHPRQLTRDFAKSVAAALKRSQ